MARKRLNGACARAMTAAVRAYQVLISSWMPPRCRFYPSCSQYMIEAIERYGPGKGLLVGLKRLARCHPFHEGGYDPLPEG